MKKSTVGLMIAVIAAALVINTLDFTKKEKYVLPTQSPFKHNVGICFNVEQTIWFADSIQYNLDLQDKYTYQRLLAISEHFKLIRIYSFFIAGWEQTGQISPE